MSAIHPGYGFLSENAASAEICQASSIAFIGPPPEVVRLIGVKEHARKVMRDAGVPVLPGSQGVLSTTEEAARTAEQIGYAVILQGDRRQRRTWDAHC